MIPYGRQNVTEEDVQAVVEVLTSDFLTQGPVVPRFERAICDYTGAQHAVAVSSGTAALHIACMALNLGEGDWLWTSPITFVASANCGLYCGAKVDFVDIDPQTWNISVPRLAEKLELARKQGNLPKVLVAVHLCGLPCDMEEIHALSKKYGFHIIEDACHAIGGKYQEDPIGTCRYSDITVFSFHPVKTITTGEGGVAVANNEELAGRMRLLREHGITRDPELMTHDPDGPWYYQQVMLGYNYRLTDIQAALGVSQLKRVDSVVARRHRIADQYDSRLSGLPIKIPHRTAEKYSGLHLYVIRVAQEATGKAHKQVFTALRELGIGVNLHYIPVPTQPYFRQLGFGQGDYPEAEKYYNEAITLPMYPELSDSDIESVITAVKAVLQ
jgi:UDP-4-amino-4,6-dideoxy-N-acetyl-beta-L-altrosamine transaminase